MQQRKSFKFYKSYFDVYNELPEKYRLQFIDALLQKEFYNINPTNLSGFSKIGYAGVKHSVDSQVNGFISKYGEFGEVAQGVDQGVEDNDKDKDKGKDKEKDKVIKPKTVFSEDILICYNLLIDFFPIQLQPEKKESWYSEIEKLNRIDKIPFELIIDIVKKTREDAFWSKNFLSLTKLRKKNKDGLKYIVVFNEKFNSVPQQEIKIGRQTLSTIEQNTKGWD